MTEELNISEILKGKSKGTKLYSPIFGECEYKTIIEHTCKGDTDSIKVKVNYSEVCFDEAGKYIFNGILSHDDREPLLFPSKEMRDWSKFAWKKGNVLISNDGKKEVFFNGFTDDTYALFKAKHGFEVLSDGNTIYLADEDGIATSDYTLENKDAAQTYINTIEERLGGKLNLETLVVEKPQPEFKDGDIVFMKGIKSKLFANCIFILRSEYKDGDERAFYYAFYNVDDKYTLDEYGNTKVHYSLRLATDSEKQQLFDALAKKGKTWDAEKKEVVNLKPKVELKPFDKVLVRDSESDKWRANLFGYIDKDGYYHCVYANWAYCIPYIGNESLLGTIKDVEGVRYERA